MTSKGTVAVHKNPVSLIDTIFLHNLTWREIKFLVRFLFWIFIVKLNPTAFWNHS